MRVQQSNYINGVNQPVKETNNQLGKDEFLKILIVQLQNQDPLNPMEDKDFIAQMAQFSTLEQIQNMAHDFQTFKALQLVGKMVYGEMNIEGTSQIIPILGRVNSASFIDGRMLLHVGDYTLPLEDLVTVFSEEEAIEIEQPATEE